MMFILFIVLQIAVCFLWHINGYRKGLRKGRDKGFDDALNYVNSDENKKKLHAEIKELVSRQQIQNILEETPINLN